MMMVVINISLFNWSFFLSYPFAVLHKRDLHIRIWKSKADDDDNRDNNDDDHDDVVCFEAADNDLDDQGDQNHNHDENAWEYEDDHDENTWKSPNIHLFEILALHHDHLAHNSSKKIKWVFDLFLIWKFNEYGWSWKRGQARRFLYGNGGLRRMIKIN